MDFWGELAGQDAVVETLKSAADPRNASSLAHAWLLTGPPGSGRYNAALRFATELMRLPDDNVSRETLHAQVSSGAHPDVLLVRTQTNDLTVAQMREVVAAAYYMPSVASRKVIIIEDADRMNSHAANTILKALEEPPESTVWILCAPSESDLLPTIRSRCRAVRLITPDPAAAAQLLSLRDGVPAELAARAAKLAQGHIGMARTLAKNPEMMQQREEIITKVLAISGISGAMSAAAQLYELAIKDSEQLISGALDREKRSCYKL